jgi:hypothetical protein
MPHVFVSPWDVVYFWGCVPDPERRASSSVADAQGLGLAGAHADVVDLIFQIAAPLWWEARLAAWRAAWQIVETTIEEGEDEVRIYQTTQPWADDLYTCQVTLGCGYGCEDCVTVPDFVGYPFGTWC